MSGEPRRGLNGCSLPQWHAEPCVPRNIASPAADATTEEIRDESEAPAYISEATTTPWAVVVDPTLDLPGRTMTGERRIVLREWDSEVLLHECLHALLHDGGFIETNYYGPEPVRRVVGDEEAIVQFLSRGLERLR